MDIVIRPHAFNPETHCTCIVTTRKGYSYATVWVMEQNIDKQIIHPTKAEVKESWNSDRRWFEPYKAGSY